jgi:hypothetical protein
MKPLSAFFLAIIFVFTAVFNVSAQSSETIWLVASGNAYKTGETILVTVNAASATPIQGFTFQIRYDPACLQPTQSTSSVPGMNGLQLPQTKGLVDASYASTTPQTVNGALAEVRFVTLGGCQTNITLESAALAIRNESGFAAPLAGVSLGEKTLAFNVDKERGESTVPPISGTPLILGEVPAPTSTLPAWLIGLLSIIFGGGVMFWVFKLINKGPSSASKKTISTSDKSESPLPATPGSSATVQIKRGPHAGKNFSLRKLPCHIGSDPLNEICLEDPFVTKRHAKIFANNGGYYLLGLAGETFINGAVVTKTAAPLKPGDMVRLGQNVFFTFAA